VFFKVSNLPKNFDLNGKALGFVNLGHGFEVAWWKIFFQASLKFKHFKNF